MATAGNRLTEKLFPYTPIEIVFELGKFAIYLEGDWYANSEFYPSARFIDYIIVRNFDDWLYPCTRINPNWNGWEHIKNSSIITASEQATTGHDGVPRNHDKCLEA